MLRNQLIFCVYFLTLADDPEERLPFLKLISVATEIHKEIISFSGKRIMVINGIGIPCILEKYWWFVVDAKSEF